MLFKAQITVLGAKSSKGDYNGKPYDSTTVYIQTDLQEGENFCGQVGDSMKWGLSSNFQKIKDLEYPLLCEVTMNQVSNGKSMVTVITDLVPVVKQAQKSA